VRWASRVWAFIGVAVLAAALALVAHETGLLARAERTTIDARFAARGAQRAPAAIVIVAIDQNSLAQLPRFPFPRSLYAPVLDRLHADGARVVGFDIEFNRPTTQTADNALIGAVLRNRPVVLATTLINSAGRTEVLGGPLVQRQIGARVGATLAIPDSSGVIRRIPYSVRGLPSFAVVMASALRGQRVAPAPFGRDGALIDYLGPARTFETVSFIDVLQGRAPASLFRHKAVIIGVTAPSAQDIHPSPLGLLPGAEIQANALATILRGFLLSNAPGWVTVLLIVALAMIAPAASAFRGALITLVAAATALVLLLLGSQIAFDDGTIVDFSDSVLALGLATIGAVAVDYVLKDRDHRRLRELFAAYSPEVVAQVLAAPEASRFGGPPLAATSVIGGYRIDQVIGRGGMGVVYKATQLDLGRPVAVKLISAEYARDPAFRERFKRESRLAASVEHANVIPVYEAGEDDGLLFIAMRYVDGVDLGALVERLGPLAPLRACAIVAEIAGALDAAHARGLVHRDVKPANVLITDDQPEHAYLTDFGVAMTTTSAETLTSPGQVVGTVDYIAPELARGQAADRRSDVYSLGGVLFFALTGSVPYPLESAVARLMAHVNAPAPRPSSDDPHLAAFDPVVGRAMAKDPEDRYGTAGDLAVAAGAAAHAAELV
jgi:CHASE2 domain-containing sensor protein/predicted Ser/Thr protein kinase